MEFDLGDLVSGITISTECPICQNPFNINTTDAVENSIIECSNCQSKIQLDTIGLE